VRGSFCLKFILSTVVNHNPRLKFQETNRVIKFKMLSFIIVLGSVLCVLQWTIIKDNSKRQLTWVIRDNSFWLIKSGQVTSTHTVCALRSEPFNIPYKCKQIC